MGDLGRDAGCAGNDSVVVASASPYGASLFNSYLLAHTLRAVYETDLHKQLESGISVADISSHPAAAVLKVTMAILSDHGVVEFNNGAYRLNAKGHSLGRDHGFMTWLIGGYTEYLHGLKDVIAGVDSAHQSDAANVARGSSQIDQQFLRANARKLILEHAPNALADLGCGDGSRLFDLLQSRPTLKGVGIERSRAGARLALENRARLGLESRVQLIEGDCLADLRQLEFCAEVDTVTSFFLLHDLLHARDGRFDEVVTLIKRSFPRATRLMLADTTCDAFDSGAPPPIFSRGFQLVHAMMKVRLRTRAEYEALFRASPARLVATHPLQVPNSFLFVLHI